MATFMVATDLPSGDIYGVGSLYYDRVEVPSKSARQATCAGPVRSAT